MSLRAISTELAWRGFLNENGCPLRGGVRQIDVVGQRDCKNSSIIGPLINHSAVSAFGQTGHRTDIAELPSSDPKRSFARPKASD
jgi:hypothetical protein